MARILSLNISPKTGTAKQPVDSIEVQEGFGMKDDAHAGNWHRQLSLLAMESIEKMRPENPGLQPGSFAENITTQGIDLQNLPIGTRLRSGEVELEITQIGKKCHVKCEIYRQAGSCIMPTEGVFARVLRSGVLTKGAEIWIEKN